MPRIQQRRVRRRRDCCPPEAGQPFGGTSQPPGQEKPARTSILVLGRTRRSAVANSPFPVAQERGVDCDLPEVGFVTRNVARGRRTRELLERRRPRGIIEVDEFPSLLDAAVQL